LKNLSIKFQILLETDRQRSEAEKSKLDSRGLR